VQLLAEFVPNDRNRMMYMTYKFANFKEKDQAAEAKRVILENDLSQIQDYPVYLTIRTGQSAS
jgi:hypothetical protein